MSSETTRVRGDVESLTMTDHTNADGKTARFLVRTASLGLAAHIPDAAGSPLCKLGLKMSLWHLQDCLLRPVIVCKKCTVMQAKLARS